MDTLSFLLLCLLQCLVAWPMVGAFFFGCSNCCVACGYMSDTFSGSLDLWSVESGTWSISSGSLTTSSSDAIILASGVTTTGGKGGVQVTISANASGKPRVIMGWVDTNNYCYVEFVNGSPPAAYQVASGVTTALPRAWGNNGAQACQNYSNSSAPYVICWDGDELTVRRNPLGNYCVFIAQNIGDGGIGLGSGAAFSVTYDDVAIYNPADKDAATTECPCCPSCGGACSDGLPETVEVTIPASTFSASPPGDSATSICACQNLNDKTYVLTRQTDVLSGGGYGCGAPAAYMSCYYRAEVTGITCEPALNGSLQCGSTMLAEITVGIAKLGGFGFATPGCATRLVWVTLGIRSSVFTTACKHQVVWKGDLGTYASDSTCQGRDIVCQVVHDGSGDSTRECTRFFCFPDDLVNSTVTVSL